MEKFNVRVEFESTPIRHLAVQCPECKSWFYSSDICNNEVNFEYQLYNMDCTCPKCGHNFEGNANIDECEYPEVYKDVLKRQVTWK